MRRFIVLLSSLILFSSILSSIYLPVEAESGPRANDLYIRAYADVEAAYQALKAGDVDMIGYELTTELYYDAITDPNICLGSVGDRGMYQFDINSNHTIQAYPGVESPTYGIKRTEFRKAITLLVNKTRIVQDYCDGFSDRIDQPISYIQKGWRNTSYWYEDSSGYDFDPEQAAQVLDSAGFTQGTTPNPSYNSTYPGSAEFIRTYPQDHPTHAGQDLHDLRVCVRTDDIRRMKAGRALCDELRLAGIPVNQIEGPSTLLYPIVMDKRDYHVYPGGWSLGMLPPISLHGFYSGQYWFKSGANYVTGCKSPNDTIPIEHQPPDPTWTPAPGGECDINNRNFPKLDYYLYKARYPSSSIEAKEYLQKALGYGWGELFITVPLFSARSFWAWSNNIKGVVLAYGGGLENGYNFMNIYKTGGGMIRYGLKSAPLSLNVIHSGWYYDSQILDRFNLWSGLDNPPYDSSIIQPGFISDWTYNTWVDPDDGEEKALVTRCYRSDNYFKKYRTGELGENVNCSHVYASIWYLYQEPGAWTHTGVLDIKTLRMINCSHFKPGQTGLEIYWGDPGYWNVYLGNSYVLSFDWFKLEELSNTVNEVLASDGDGYLSCSEPVFWIKSASANGDELTVGVGIDIYKSKSGHVNEADIRVINSSYIGVPINVTYLAVDDPSGYTPGNVDYEHVFVGCGMYYAYEVSSSMGFYAYFKRNPTYCMETPPLGEVDFVKKSNGCHKIDIFDVVMAASAYGSQGIAVPDEDWLPGADLADPSGVIDIFDITTITGKYGMEWDCDP